MIFDDYGWRVHDLTTNGIEAFLLAYQRIINPGIKETQVFIKKI